MGDNDWSDDVTFNVGFQVSLKKNTFKSMVDGYAAAQDSDEANVIALEITEKIVKMIRSDSPKIKVIDCFTWDGVEEISAMLRAELERREEDDS